MACDMCGKTGTNLEQLNDKYKTDDIQSVCSKCSTLLNDHLYKLRKVLAGTVKLMIIEWMKNFKKNKSK